MKPTSIFTMGNNQSRTRGLTIFPRKRRRRKESKEKTYLRIINDPFWFKEMPNHIKSFTEFYISVVSSMQLYFSMNSCLRHSRMLGLLSGSSWSNCKIKWRASSEMKVGKVIESQFHLFPLIWFSFFFSPFHLILSISFLKGPKPAKSSNVRTPMLHKSTLVVYSPLSFISGDK